MLPDFPETKRLFSRVFQTYMRQRVRQLSPFGIVPTRYIHEGRGMKVTRADESETNSEVQTLSSPMEVKIEEIEHLTFQKVIEKYDAVVLDIVRKQTGLMFERLSSDIPANQSVSAKGKPQSGKLILEMLEAIQLEFYPDGTPHELHTIGGLFTPQQLEAAYKELEDDPVLKQRHEELIARKREEWRAREADRKLVG